MCSRPVLLLELDTDYICFLLYLKDMGDDETSWMKLTTDNLLLISCVGLPGSVGGKADLKDTQVTELAGPNSFSLFLVMTFVTIFFLSHVFFLVSVVQYLYFHFAPSHEETHHYLLAFPLYSSSFIISL